MHALREYWARLSERERLILAAGGAFLILVVLYLLLWQPLLDARARLAKLLPRQQQTLQSVRQLTAQLGVMPASAMLDLEQALAKAGSVSSVAPANKQMLAPQRVKLSFDAVSFGQWLDFAVAMQSAGWPVGVMDVTRGDTGKVKVVAEFGR